MTTTASPPAALTEREMLLRACLLDAGDDTRRLVLADHIEERGDEEWAELIRVQIELRTCSVADRRFYLVFREQQLFHDLRARLLPPCPGHRCEDGWVKNYDDGGRVTQSYCDICNPEEYDPTTFVGPGVCPGTIERGLGVVTVPLSALGEEVVEQRETEMFPKEFGGMERLETRAARCAWVASSFARSCVRRGVGFLVSDREPWKHSTIGFGWSALGNHGAHHIPESLFSQLRGDVKTDSGAEFCNFRFYPTADAARRALGAALIRSAL